MTLLSQNRDELKKQVGFYLITIKNSTNIKNPKIEIIIF